ncbi:unnamed protein product [Nesidiocoris tenuis]|uniref:Uncharacterized protein n=1 Tax=Nesidiocoris tenuis TaxID=355587 RepID=A0A6H5H526_9HEMI|nr:unnamed protein product [Nesidiocoris tenuis]
MSETIHQVPPILFSFRMMEAGPPREFGGPDDELQRYNIANCVLTIRYTFRSRDSKWCLKYNGGQSSHFGVHQKLKKTKERRDALAFSRSEAVVVPGSITTVGPRKVNRCSRRWLFARYPKLSRVCPAPSMRGSELFMTYRSNLTLPTVPTVTPCYSLPP